METTTITNDTDAVTAVWFACLGGKFRVQLTDGKPGERGRSGYVLDDNDIVIGDANDLIYGMSGFAVHTRPFAGFVPNSQIEFV